MGIFDRFKKKTGDLAEEHGDKAEDAIEAGAEFVDDKTGSRYTDQIDAGAEKAKDFIEDFGDDDDE